MTRGALAALALVAALTVGAVMWLLGSGPAPLVFPDAGPAVPTPPSTDAGPPDAGPPPIPELELAAPPVQSELDAEVLARLRALVAAAPDRRDDVFAKIGGSSVVSRQYLYCFADDRYVELGAHGALRPTLEHFRGGRAWDRNPFSRDSEAAGVSFNTVVVTMGRPSRLMRELRMTRARWALLFVGANDAEGRDEVGYGRRMMPIVEATLAEGALPILGTIHPGRGDDDDRWVRRYNAILHAMALAYRVPIVDFHRAMQGLPTRGLGHHGSHPGVYAVHGRVPRGCHLTPAGLEHGDNVRNLETLRMLDRLRRGLEAPSPPVGFEDPDRVHRLPFGALRDGPEPLRMRVAGEVTVRATVIGPARDSAVLHIRRGGETVLSTARTAVAALTGADYEITIEIRQAGKHLVALTEDP